MEENIELRNTLASGDFTPEGKTKKRTIIITIVVVITLAIIAVIILMVLENEPSSDKIDMSKWLYNEEDSLYYQLGITYCNEPIDLNYQQLAIFIPKQYMNCDASDKINEVQYYKCKINNELNNTINNITFNSKNAPFVFQIETPGYAAAESMKEYPKTGYISPKDYTKNGIIYFYPGCRGREHGAPLGVVDLKAAVVFIKNLNDLIPGNKTRIFSVGMSGGGAQSALMGVTGNSKNFNKYLEQIDVDTKIDNSVFGSMCYCPITSLDTGDEAYEWMLSESRDSKENLSKPLAKEYKNYINKMQFVKPSQNKENSEILELDKFVGEGYYQNGSYYDYIKSEVERSFENWVIDTKFPYEKKDSPFPPGPIPPTLKEDMIFNNLSEYINYLNNGTDGWLSYNNDTKKATITDLVSFTKKCKKGTKQIGAYDQLDRGSGENQLFGTGNNTKLHFDAILANYSGEEEEEFKKDFEQTDSLGMNVIERLRFYSPLNYIKNESEVKYESKIAKYWRIRSGIFQSDTSFTTEVNLMLALKENENVKSVDFEAVWEKEHTPAERGDAENADEISKWIKSIYEELEKE